MFLFDQANRVGSFIDVLRLYAVVSNLFFVYPKKE